MTTTMRRTSVLGASLLLLTALPGLAQEPAATPAPAASPWPPVATFSDMLYIIKVIMVMEIFNWKGL